MIPQTITTKQGALPLPLFVPLLTLPLGERTVPYLHQLSYCVALDPFTQLTPETLPALPKWVVPYQLHQTDRWTPADGYAVCVNGQRLERDTLLQFQKEYADIGLTLAIPPGSTQPSIRLQRSCDNARWALQQQSGIPLLATLPFTTVEDTCLAIQSLWSPKGGFAGIALWVNDPLLDDLLELVKTIRQVFEGPLHLCGVDDPAAWTPLLEVGLSSLHSTHWLDWAQQGRKFGVEGAIPNPTRDETLHLALLNLALATQLSIPLSMVAPDFSTWLLRNESFQLPTPSNGQTQHPYPMTRQAKATKPTATPIAQSTAPDAVAHTPDAIVDSPDESPTAAERNEAERNEAAAATDSAITPAETQAVVPIECPPLITDPFDYSKTAVTVSYIFLPEDGHPEGRTVLVSLHTTGQKPLFSQVPLREQSEALKDAVAELQERYKVYLPEHKVQVEQEAAEKAAAAKEASAARTAMTVKSKVPATHAEAIQGGDAAVVVAEKKLSLFG